MSLDPSGSMIGRQATQGYINEARGIERPSVRQTLLNARLNHEAQLARINEALELLDAAPQIERLHDLLNSIR